MAVTKHAKKRIKERCGISKKSSDRLVEMVKENGLTKNNATGQLKRYLIELCERYENNVNIAYVYGDKIYLFANDDILVTVLDVPNVLKKQAIKQTKRYKKNGIPHN